MLSEENGHHPNFKIFSSVYLSLAPLLTTSCPREGLPFLAVMVSPMLVCLAPVIGLMLHSTWSFMVTAVVFVASIAACAFACFIVSYCSVILSFCLFQPFTTDTM